LCLVYYNQNTESDEYVYFVYHDNSNSYNYNTIDGKFYGFYDYNSSFTQGNIGNIIANYTQDKYLSNIRAKYLQTSGIQPLYNASNIIINTS
jgi:hypothetical protein